VIHELVVTMTTAPEGLLIRGGMVLDGTGAPGFRADVRVGGGRIIDIGADLTRGEERVLDASGAYVAPGFIESHTHLDPSLFWDASCDPLPQHGVTSALVGNCSLGLAPIRPEHVAGVCELFSYIEDIPLDSFVAGVPWDWATYPEYRRRVGGIASTLTIDDLVGHSLLRLWVIGHDAWERAATAAEVAAMADVLESALLCGASGLSTSLFDRDADGRMVPSAHSDEFELSALISVLGRYGRILEFIPEVRTDQWLDDVDRFANLCGPHRVPLTFNGISCDLSRPGWFGKALDQAERFLKQGIQVVPQISPRPIDIQVNWSGGMSFSYLPNWQQMILAPAEQKTRMLADPAWRDAARQDWDTIQSNIIPNRAPDRILLISVTRPPLSEWVGRSLADLSDARGQHPSDALAGWVLDNDLSPGVMSKAIRNDDTDDVARSISHPLSLVSNSDAGAHLNMFCGAGDSTLLLTRFVRDRQDLTVEQAVHELTRKQADLLGFYDRGLLKAGARADLTVFSLDEIHWSEPTVEADLPSGGTRLRRPEGGYRYTMVNGVLTQEGGVLTGQRPAGGRAA
jgi:N-acyl-D-amino-acid deacylase